VDSVQANNFCRELLAEHVIDDWNLKSLLGHGKSAVVIQAEHAGTNAALKVFHPAVIERIGLDAQLIRIEREKMLVGTEHPALVSILGGGLSSLTKRPYIAMSLVSGIPMSESLGSIPRAHIPSMVEQLARAAKHLEDIGVVHRDIKPDNIMVIDDAMSKIKLLDFGVMRPVGDSSATDQPGHKCFVGTHQYSPPEMLHRREADSIEGWRAITFYQIGAVLHDLLMRKRIFEAHQQTFANLIEAIDEELPLVETADVDQILVSLARRCLLKNPAERIRLVAWGDFFFSEHSGPPSAEARKVRLFKKQQWLRAELDDRPLARIERARLDTRRMEIIDLALRGRVDAVLSAFAEHLPPRTVKLVGSEYPAPVIHCAFPADAKLGFQQPFHLQVSVGIDAQSSVVEVFCRAGTGETPSELGWTHLGGFLDDLSELQPVLEDWVLGILEQLIQP
jgi:eukaryotic-like serine/threonine-protein kinase